MPTSPISLSAISKLLDQKLSNQEKSFDSKLDQKLKAQRKDIVDTIFEHFPTKNEHKEDVARLEKKIDHLPTKEEYYSKMDRYIKETQTVRTNQAVQSQQIADHSDRLQKVETNLGLVTS